MKGGKRTAGAQNLTRTFLTFDETIPIRLDNSENLLI